MNLLVVLDAQRQVNWGPDTLWTRCPNKSHTTLSGLHFIITIAKPQLSAAVALFLRVYNKTLEKIYKK